MKNKQCWQGKMGCEVNTAHTSNECTGPAAHTPTPWNVDKQTGDTVYIESVNGEFIAECSSDAGLEEAGVNASFIVKAVNCFEIMLEALKSVDPCDVKAIARVKVQNAILRAEELI